ncbi:NACHT multi-domain protein [Pyrenophora tritici-repentis]|nr:NACHT multi-domain protein [Pyrenophora tritici-repentis]KAF7444969.1 NACHT multi-domain protein [Pyrenophora tritici-repentis]
MYGATPDPTWGFTQALPPSQEYSESRQLQLATFFDDGDIPPYTILSHTWGADGDEVTFADLQTGGGKTKPGYEKILFCGKRARRDNLQYFWIDTCCIDKANKAELAFSIRSMFRWYRDAASCYAYLSDVWKRKRKAGDRAAEISWEPAFRSSRWFTRGWTLQELLAPTTVEFFSQEGDSLGSKTSLQTIIREITSIPSEVLNGTPLSRFSVNERLRWAEGRTTGRVEDRAYCLQGILDVELAPVYGEGEAGAFDRLKREMYKLEQCIQDIRQTDPLDDKKRIEETKGGLLADSYRWALDNATFRQWYEDQQSRLLWVKGDPGKGKTMLLCGIIDELQNSLPQTALLSYFFCQATDLRINNATAVLRGLLYMLVRQQPLLASHVRRKHDHAGKSLFEDANAWVALTEIFADVLQDASLGTTYLIIDALDECVTDLPRLLTFIAKQSSASSRVKWIVSSRNWPAIKEELEHAEHKMRLSLELNAESVAAAVEVFIQQKAYDPSSIATNNLSEILLRLQAAKEIAEYEKDALRAALHVHQKPRNRHEPPLDLQQRKAFHSGAVWWSPCKLREARFRQLVKEKEKEKELLDKIELKEAKENNRIYQLKIKEAARAAREEAKKVRDEAKAVKAAELDAKRRDRDAAKAIQQPQSGKRKASKPAAKQQPKKRRVGGAGGGTLAEVAAPAPPPTTTRRGRAVNTPAKYR